MKKNVLLQVLFIPILQLQLCCLLNAQALMPAPTDKQSFESLKERYEANRKHKVLKKMCWAAETFDESICAADYTKNYQYSFTSLSGLHNLVLRRCAGQCATLSECFAVLKAANYEDYERAMYHYKKYHSRFIKDSAIYKEVFRKIKLLPVDTTEFDKLYGDCYIYTDCKWDSSLSWIMFTRVKTAHDFNLIAAKTSDSALKQKCIIKLEEFANGINGEDKKWLHERILFYEDELVSLKSKK